MTVPKALGYAFIGIVILGAAVTAPRAFCDSSVETYALFGCADLNYFAPVPSPWTPADVSAVFWQIGFGNETLQTGQGTDGTGVQSKSNFNGNDHGTFQVSLVDACDQFCSLGFAFPPGSTCLASNNWANAGIDGCCDDTRSAVPFSYFNNYTGYGPYLYPNDDNYLNPYQALYFKSIGYPGYLSYASIQDYPTALLITTPDGFWFNLSAVSNMSRNNDGTPTGPCNAYGGTNAAACDIRQGYYEWQAVTNGQPNVLRAGNDVVPWQAVPRPEAVCITGCSAGETVKTVLFQIPAVHWYHDGSLMPTNNPTLATRDLTKTRDSTRAGGVGVVDLLRRWNGLVQYDLEQAYAALDPNGDIDYPNLSWSPLTDPNGTPYTGLTAPTDPVTGEPTGPVGVQEQVFGDTCFRTRVHFGKAPEEKVTTNAANCRIGRCGDVGYELASSNPLAITCVAGPILISETIQSPSVTSSQGRYRISWSTSVEVTVTGFEIQALTKRGPRTLQSVPCKECASGLGADYAVEIPRSAIKGGRLDGFRIVMEGGNGSTADLPVR